MESERQILINKIIDLYFNTPKVLYNHLFQSYEQFINEIIPYSLINEPNYFYTNITNNEVYMHGFKFTNVRFKPATFDNDNMYKFPSDARKNHLNYFGTIIADVQQFYEKVNNITNEKIIKLIGNLEKDTQLAGVPIMVKSLYCSTTIKKDVRNECKFDPGGYFIVGHGAEKVVMSMDKMVDNKILIFTKKDNTYQDGLMHIAQINSKYNDWSDNLQILTIKNKKDNVLIVSTSSQLVDIPLFILMRALGVESDQHILNYITYNLNDNDMLNLLRPTINDCVDDSDNPIRTKEAAIEYLLKKLKRTKRISQTDMNVANIQKRLYLNKILATDLLPHLGTDLTKKIVFLGLMVNRLLNTILKRNQPDDRDALYNKRIELPGILLGQLFRQNWKKLLNDIGKHFKKKNQSDEEPINVINQIKPSIIEQGLKKALATGTWGMNKSKKGVAQTLSRISWLNGISCLRRILSPSSDDSSGKIISIRYVRPCQIQFLCVTGDTEILLGNGMDTKLIKDITNDDIVMSVNPETLKQEPTQIFNKFSKMPDKLLQIVISSGKTIKVTPEHPFLVNNDNIYLWKKAEDLTKMDKLIIRHVEKYIHPEKSVSLSLNIDNMSDNYKSELMKLGLLDNFQNNKLVILARLIGILNNADIDSNNNCIFIINSDKDANDISNDITSLGFGQPEISRSIFSNTWTVTKNGTFAYLLYLLENNYKKSIFRYVPQWIINGNKSVKREYLAALQTEGTEILNSYEYSINITNYYEIDKYLNQLSLLYNEFGIKTFINRNSNKYILSFDTTTKNIFNYINTIGYRYSNTKRNNANNVIEYLSYDLKHTLSFEDFVKNNTKNDLVFVDIKEITEIEPERVYDFTTKSNNHSFIGSSFVVHNCPYETPEGQKIGIVKHLSMMSTVTCQNSSQKDVLKTLIKYSSDIRHPFDIDPLTMNNWIKIIINGDFQYVCKLTYAYEFYNFLKQKRRERVIDIYTTILFDYNKKEIRIHYDGGRLIRPVLIVKDNNLNITNEVIKFVNAEALEKDKTKSWNKLLNKFPDLFEYEDIESTLHCMIAENETKVEETLKLSKEELKVSSEVNKINRYGTNRWVNYTHCDFHEWTMLGNSVANIPFSNHNFGNRLMIGFSQSKQSIGTYLSSHKDRMDISQILYHPQVPLSHTRSWKYNGCYDLPYGENIIVAIASYTGYNQEDSMIFNQSSIDRGMLRVDTIKKYNSEIAKNPSTSQDDIFTKPDRNKVTSMKQGNYDKLNDKGYVEEETKIENEDIIIGKISPIQPIGNNNKVYKDSSEIFKSNVPGVVDRIHTGILNSEGYEMYNMKVRMERIPMVGDKFTNLHGQKGTIGLTLPQKDMPFSTSGIVPDMILNPHGIPSRMSMGQIIECIVNKEAALTGHFVDGTPYTNFNINEIPKALKKLGLSPYGTETMYCGLTGRKMEMEIFMGPIYTIRLKHMVLDKVHGRAHGPRQALTRQPLEGRTRDGGFKIGEMEQNSIVAHGMGQFLKERFMETSDITKVHVCDECGMFATKVIDKDYYKCKGCKNSTNISAVAMPYACKLLFQELTSVNILPRIRTENINTDD
jgi:DNA-directed RNA polymerase beta subunit/intein/homing endonuclease